MEAKTAENLCLGFSCRRKGFFAKVSGYDSTGRYEYLNGRAQESLVEVSGKGVARNGVRQSGKRVEKQVTGKQKTAKKKESWGAIAGREARLERERLERTGEEFDWRKYM